MATVHEQEVAKDLVVAWLNSLGTGSVPIRDLQDPEKAGSIIANIYKTLVKAVNETSTPAEGRDATG